MNRRRSLIVLVAIAAFMFLLAAVLSYVGASVDDENRRKDAGPAAAKAARVVYPRDRRPAPDPSAGVDSASPKQAPGRLDAMQRAVLAPGGRGAVFVEANAIRHAPLVEKILACREQDAVQAIDDMKRNLGIDPLEDVDRFGFDGNVMVASGFFEKLKVPAELGAGTAYGDHARVWQGQGEEGTLYVAQVQNDMLVTGATEADVHAAIDRAEGRAPAGEPLGPELSNSELYGSIGKDMLSELLGKSQDPTLLGLAGLVTGSNVRMNVNDAVALSLDVGAVDDGARENLQKAARGALALARKQAEDAGETELAGLIDQARINTGADGRIALDVAVPGEFFLRTLGCDADGNRIPGMAAPSADKDEPAAGSGAAEPAVGQ